MKSLNLAIGETGWNQLAHFYGKMSGKFDLIRGPSVKSRLRRYAECEVKLGSFNIFCDSIVENVITVKTGYGWKKNVTIDLKYNLAMMLDGLIDEHSFIRLNTNRYDGNDLIARMVSAYHVCPVVLAVQKSFNKCDVKIYCAPSVSEKFSDGLFDGILRKYTDSTSSTWDFDFPGHDIVDWEGQLTQVIASWK